MATTAMLMLLLYPMMIPVCNRSPIWSFLVLPPPPDPLAIIWALQTLSLQKLLSQEFSSPPRSFQFSLANWGKKKKKTNNNNTKKLTISKQTIYLFANFCHYHLLHHHHYSMLGSLSLALSRTVISLQHLLMSSSSTSSFFFFFFFAKLSLFMQNLHWNLCWNLRWNLQLQMLYDCWVLPEILLISL